MYLPFLQVNTGRGQMALYVAVSGNAGDMTRAIRSTLRSIDPKMALLDMRTLSQELGAVLVQERLIATLSGFFAVLALLLASIGLYGLFSYAVVQRTGEIGIRSALGAKRTHLLSEIMREALILVLWGIMIGVPVALAAGQLLASQISGLLFGLTVTDPFTIAVSAATLLLAAGLASYFPARRASRVDPMVALRSE